MSLSSLHQSDDEYYDDLHTYVVPGVLRPETAEDIEKKGWRHWLMRLMPFRFEEDFSADHIKFWDQFWSVLMRIKRQQAYYRMGVIPRDPHEEEAFFREKGIYIEDKEYAVLLIMGRGLAKCLDGDTTISLSDGTTQTIREIAIGTPILSFNEVTGRIEHDIISNKWVSGLKRCLNVKTRSKKTLDLTAEHRVLTINGWKVAGDLTTDDYIASPRRTTIEPQEFEHPDEEVRLLAYFLAEGCTREHQRATGGQCLTATITNADEPIRRDVEYCAERLGFKSKVGPRYNLYLSGGVRGWIRANGMAGKLATEKRVPDWVFRIPERQKWQFLSAFIDTDGWIGQNGKIGITLANLPMIQDLQNLCLQVGVPSTITYRPNDCSGAWQLLLDQEGVNQNVDKFTLLAKCDALAKHFETRRYSLVDVYPYTVGRDVPYGVPFKVRNGGISMSHRYDITRDKLRNAIAIHPEEKWRWLEQADVFWDKVVSIEDAGERETFDVEVAGNHNLITNNLISHNSSTLEAAAAMRGCILKTGYCLYVSESKDQAEEHLGNVRELIEHDDSRVLEFYPHMLVDPNAVVNGKKTKDRTDLFITIGGWIARAKGLNAGLRGLRIGGLRPDDIKLDDIDGVNDSIAVSVKKTKQISSSIIPTQARRWATLHFGQNLITETGVVNQIHLGKVDLLAERTTIGVSNTFEHFREGIEYRTFMDTKDNRIKHRILPAAVPTWAGVNIAQAQKFLNDSGLETFLAEYMNSFEHMKTEKVYYAWDERRQVITWSDFERLFGYRYIPGHWRAKAAGDIGYSKKSRCAWFFCACSAQNSPLPSRYFAYRSRTYELDSIDDQAIDLWEDFFPDPEGREHGQRGRPHFEATQRFVQYPELFRILNTKPRCSALLKRFQYDPWSNTFVEEKLDPATATAEDKALFYVREAQKGWKSQIGSWLISHEKTGEQKTLAQKYGLPVSKTKDFKDWDGITEANHLLRGDYTQPHPFFPDEIDETTGLWKLGCPFLFIVVEDDQKQIPRDDYGFRKFREEVSFQRTTEEKLTDKGLSKTVPFKADADHPDAFRMWAKNYATPSSTKLTPLEEWQRSIPEEHRYVPPEKRDPDKPIITAEMQMAMEEARGRAAEEFMERKGLTDEDLEDDYI